MKGEISIESFEIKAEGTHHYFDLRIPKDQNLIGIYGSISGYKSRWDFGSRKALPLSAGRLSLQSGLQVIYSGGVDFEPGILSDETPFGGPSFPQLNLGPWHLIQKRGFFPLATRSGSLRGLYQDELNLSAQNPQPYIVKLYLQKGGVDD